MLHPLRVRNALRRRLRRAQLPVFYDPAFRIPLPTLGGVTGMETRRADFVLWSLLDLKVLHPDDVYTPSRISYADTALVHTEAFLESLTLSETLMRIFPVEAADLPIDELIGAFRLGSGATLEAAHIALRRGGPTFNLLGGFHHAEPDKAGGFCPINDIAIAIAVLRRDGLKGQICVLDLDAHPSDGTAACLAGQPDIWQGSISAVDWGPLPGVDETLLPIGSGDDVYLQTLDALLARMPEGALTFVIAGGDVLKGDRMGGLALTLAGAGARDLRVYDAIAGLPSVWVPGGGYTPDAWRLMFQTATILQLGEAQLPPEDFDPMRARFAYIAKSMDNADLEGDGFITADDLSDELGLGFGTVSGGAHRLLGFYTQEGLEYGLFRYGILRELQRLGYDLFRVDIDRDTTGDRARLYGHAKGAEHLLVELVVELQTLNGAQVLYVHWLSLTHPIARFTEDRPQLPGQETPGLGLAREFAEVLGRMARRLGCSGVAYRPGHYHVAYAGRHRHHFLDADRQGRFEAMMRDLKGIPLLDVTRAVADERVRMNGEIYAWEASPMVAWLEGARLDRCAVEAAAEAVHFTLTPP